MSDKTLLMIFIKNPVKGKVKTRLAKTIGEEKALSVYLQLLTHTCKETIQTEGVKKVFYSDKIEEKDLWDSAYFGKCVQEGNDLGERMYNAFRLGFAEGFTKIVIIGSDCPELSSDIIATAFSKLIENDFVIGPATDGGYYLLGMKKLAKEIFENKTWSTATVLQDTIDDLDKMKSSYYLLPVLSDVDEEKDLEFLYQSEKTGFIRPF